MTERIATDENVDTILRRADRAATRSVQRRGADAQKAVREALECATALKIDDRDEDAGLAFAAASVLWAIGRKWTGPVDEHGVLESSVATLRRVLEGYGDD